MVDLDAAIARYSAFTFDDSTTLLAAGLESLSLLRLAVDVAADDTAEIDAAGLADMRTIGELKRWLAAIASAGQADGGAW